MSLNTTESTFVEPLRSMDTMLQQSFTVLILDSNDVTRELFVEELMEINPALTLVEAATSREALQHVEVIQVDCAVIDQALAEVDGYSLLDMLRNTADLSPVPAILMLERGDEAGVPDALLSGAADYVSKASLSAAYLAKSIVHAIERNRLDKALTLQKNELHQRVLELEREHDLLTREREEMAHRLLTPLSSIQEFVSLVLDGIAGPVNDKQGKYLAYARGSCQAMRQSVEQAILSRQLDMLASPLNQSCNVMELVEQTLHSFSLDAKTRGVHLGSDQQGRIPAVKIDPHEFKQVLSHLITHALNASADAGRVLVTATLNKASQSQVRIEVSTHPHERTAPVRLQDFPRKAGDREKPFFETSSVMSRGQYIVEVSFDDALRFSFDIPNNS